MTKKKRQKYPRWIACPLEEEYFGSDKKLSREERKRKSATDRSRFKKSDITKYERNLRNEIIKRAASKRLYRGRVLSITSEYVEVEYRKKIYACRVRGLLKKEKKKQKQLVTVGDFVRFEKIADKEGIITYIEERKSFLSRADNLSRRKEHILAANIDQVLITVSVITPLLRPAIIDRYIIAASAGNLKPIIIVNKIDLLHDPAVKAETRKEQKELLAECRSAYKAARIPVIELSAKTGEGLDRLKAVMKNRSSLFSGQSGTGKSSLLNACLNLRLKIKKTVKKSNKGAHATTKAHLIPITGGGFCIDAPGIKSFGLWDIEETDLKNYFSEIARHGKKCQFANCSHINEKNCAVKQAVTDKKISSLRYHSYAALLRSIIKKHRRR